ncbi:Hypothetical protein CINCED_3A011215 [Cinara cedri]|uniref:Trichohyalin-plectin-homology domain-containing protein n=2 Tax=Cinara cedri TaxID=506608 RepID=A0A5E4N051_9HEMI|nr:Hypothetical protein CINCED_3A011215 [Cinara cedri]
MLTNYQMEIVYIGDRNPNNRALLILNEEWKRLGKILTKKMDEEVTLEDGRRLKEMRRETSKRMIDGWNNTKLNKTKKLLEQKQKKLSELEAKQRQIDEEMKHEALKARNRIIEKSRKLKFEEKDIVKTFNRALQHSEVFKERAVQLKFNESMRENKMAFDLIIAQEQNSDAEQYRKNQMNEKQKNNELKKTKAELLLKELKERETNRRDEDVALFESDKMELQKITDEIEEYQKNIKAEARTAREKLQKVIADNQESTSRYNEIRRVEEQEEAMMTAIVAETKRTLAGMRRLKEIELMKAKQLALEAMRTKVAVWPKKESGWTETDMQNAVETKEKRYQDGLAEKKEWAKKRTDYMDDGKRLWVKETARQQRQLAQDHELEAKRLEREKRLLIEFAKLREKTQIETINQIRSQLDQQCNDKTAAVLADRQTDINHHKMIEQLWFEEDKEFVTYARNIIEKKKLDGNPIKPLLKTVNDYLKKNNLYIDQVNKVSKKQPKGSIYTSRIIQHTD